MSRTMMALGKYRFSVDTAAYQRLMREQEYRWASQPRLGRRPARQFIGAGEERIELEGTIYPHFRGGLGQIDAMRDEANAGEPLLLVDGRGNVWGKYGIERITETQTRFHGNGVPLKIEFQLVLSHYGEDAGDGTQAAGGARSR